MKHLNKKIKFLAFLLLPMISTFSCDNQDIDQSQCYSGTVINEISCNSQSGFAFLIRVTDQNLADTIATTTLPKIYQTKGTIIFFRIKQPQSPLFCTTNISPPKSEYDIYNVSNKSCSNE
jgi:hypothetical protein